MGESGIRLPPHDRNAERAVLGAMLKDNGVVGDVHALLKDEDFYVHAHQVVYRAVLSLFSDGKPADVVTLSEHLSGGKAKGGEGPCPDLSYEYLVGLWDGAPSAANVTHYAEIVRGRAVLRELAHVAEHIRRSVDDGAGHASEILAEVEQLVFDIAKDREDAKSVALPRVLAEAADVLSEQMRSRVTGGTTTGLADLDKMTGGLRDGEFVILAARPSIGKTAMALQMFLACADNDVPSAFFSLEMSRQELAERIFCMRGGIDSKRLRSRHLNDAETDAIIRVCETFDHSGGLHVCDSPNMTVLRIISESRRLKLRHGIRVIYIDYLQLITPEDRRAQRHEQVSTISRRLKLLARELKIPVVCLAQLNRNSEERPDRRPRKSDLRESGSLEQDGDVVMLLHRPDADTEEDNYVVEVIVDKNRNGPTGPVRVFFRGANMRFENYQVGEPASGF